MNLVVLEGDDFVAPDRVRLGGRRLVHLREVHRAVPGRVLRVGRLGGMTGTGTVERLDAEAAELSVALDTPPPPKLPLTVVLALPRPKVLNRVVAAATSLGVARLVLVNAWRVEKAYWSSPRVAAENLRAQAILGLEQAADTVLPDLQTRRLFRPFVEDELPGLAAGSEALVAHPAATAAAPRPAAGAVTLAIGPEGGFVAAELASLERAGFRPVSLGARILRVETALAALVGRLH